MNTMLVKQRIDELTQMKMLIEHPDFIRYTDILKIVDFEVSNALDTQFKHNAVSKAQENEDKDFEKLLKYLRARNAYSMESSVFINVTTNYNSSYGK